jgi:DNA-binding response OmpR family regulator
MLTIAKDGLAESAYTVTVDDDPIICRIIEAATGIKSFSYASGADLAEDLERLSPVGVFVDIHLANHESGLEIIPKLKRVWPDAPLIAITSDPESTMVADALSAGADDFLRKPIDDVELRARLNARAAQIAERKGAALLEFGDIKLDVVKKSVTGPKGFRIISNREIGLLAQLAKAKGLIIAKKALKQHLWGDIAISDNVLDRKIYEVRKLLREVSANVELKSVYGEGLALRLRTHDLDALRLSDFEVLRRHQSRRRQEGQGLGEPGG